MIEIFLLILAALGISHREHPKDDNEIAAGGEL
jgi:hypothetical protein